ncbi:MAG: hypothetical protein E6Q97_29420 [Desulfurellales bacterium]|nr:MAG: hypothetical protein E6Q97_29420 [Desulfurellales bacterium]
MPAYQDTAFQNMTTETIGKDILSALVQEIRLLPDVWSKLPASKQDDIIERLHLPGIAGLFILEAA